MRRAAKVDRNQAEIVKALRQIPGVSVQPIHTIGKGCPDLLCGVRGVNLLMELKDGDLPKSARKLSADEHEFYRNWNGQYAIVESIDDALRLVKAVR
jgi:hypothetical protein